MKKLLQINAIANSGSTGRIAEDIGALAISKGWESHIAYGRWASNSKSNLIKIGTRWDLLTHGLKSYLLDCHGLGSAQATHLFLKKIESIKPDIIHLHNIHGYYLNYKVLFDFLSKSDVPVVWTLHDCWTITGHCCHFEYVGCNKWRSQCYKCPYLKDYPKSIFRDNSRRNYINKKALFTSVKNLTVVSVCKWLDDIVSQSFLNVHPHIVIENGVDLNKFRPRQDNLKIRKSLHLKGKYMLLGVASAWSHLKGLDDIYYFRSKLPPEYDIVLVGLTSAQLKKVCRHGITGIAATENIEELAQLYSCADIFINPTYYDTLPTVNIEAIASGTPVICYNTGGCSNIVDEKTGRIIECGDRENFLKAIKEVAIDGKQKYNNACRLRAEQNFDKQECFKSYIKLYEHILKD